MTSRKLQLPSGNMARLEKAAQSLEAAKQNSVKIDLVLAVNNCVDARYAFKFGCLTDAEVLQLEN